MSARPLARVGPRISGKWGPIVLFILPALILYLIFVIIPVIQAVYYSLFDWNSIEPLDKMIGLKNYSDALNDELFTGAIKNNIFVIILSLTIQIPFSLSVAIFLNGHFPGRTIFRLIFFIPYVISDVIAGILFTLILSPTGPLNGVLSGVGINSTPDWLGLGDILGIPIVMWTMFIVITWRFFGYHMILLLAGLQGIPREIEEAALIDGANRWQAFRHVTLPLLGPTLRVSIFLSIIGSLQLFDIVWVMTRGGPVDLGHTMSTYMFHFGFERNQFGYGSAVAVILFVLALAFSLLYNRFVLRRDVEGSVTSFSG